jgi:hypothetical protein
MTIHLPERAAQRPDLEGPQMQAAMRFDARTSAFENPAKTPWPEEVLESIVRPQPHCRCRTHRRLPQAVGRGQHEMTARLQHSKQLDNRRFRIGRMLDRLARDHHVEGIGCEAERRERPDHCAAAVPHARRRRELRADVERDHPRAPGRHRAGEPSDPASAIEHEFAAEIDPTQKVVDENRRAAADVVLVHEVVEPVHQPIVRQLLLARPGSHLVQRSRTAQVATSIRRGRFTPTMLGARWMKARCHATNTASPHTSNPYERRPDK